MDGDRTTRQVAAELDCSIQTVLRIAVRLDIEPVFQTPVRRGAKMWSPQQVDLMRAELERSAA